jgi:hypothetical protein
MSGVLSALTESMLVYLALAQAGELNALDAFRRQFDDVAFHKVGDLPKSFV